MENILLERIFFKNLNCDNTVLTSLDILYNQKLFET